MALESLSKALRALTRAHRGLCKALVSQNLALGGLSQASRGLIHTLRHLSLASGFRPWALVRAPRA